MVPIYDGGRFGGFEHAGFGWWAVPRLLLTVAFLALVVLAVVAVVRWMREGSWRMAGPSAYRDAEATLAERFARGEIDADQLRQALEVLRASRGSGARGSTP